MSLANETALRVFICSFRCSGFIKPNKAGVTGLYQLTSNDLGSLKVLIGMNVAGRNGQVESDRQQREINSGPHRRPCLAEGNGRESECCSREWRTDVTR